jgi:hypothetical protein
MKWILTEKAKPKFKQLYLLTNNDAGGVWLGSLAESKVTPDGVQHLFTDGTAGTSPAKYLAAVTAPGKEVGNG